MRQPSRVGQGSHVGLGGADTGAPGTPGRISRPLRWATARVSHAAWEYNGPLVSVADCGPDSAGPFVETSANVIVEALHRYLPNVKGHPPRGGQ